MSAVGPSGKRAMLDAVDVLRGHPDVIVIQRRRTTADGVPGDWTVSTQDHNTSRPHIDSVLLIVQVLLEQQAQTHP